MATHTCKNKTCGKTFEVNKPGRPPAMCPECREQAAELPPANWKPSARDIERMHNEPKLDLDAHLSTKEDEVRGSSSLNLLPKADQYLEEMNLADEVIILPPAAPAFAFHITITNMGVAFQGNEEAEAKKRFKHYVDASIAGYGQVGHEKVSFFAGSELVDEFDYCAYKEGSK